MRVIKEISHSDCKITIFAWNNRYLIKLEQGPFEQTFKVDSFETTEQEVVKMIDSEFLTQASNRFREMGQSLHDALGRVAL